jgi:hypothetical protein
VFGGHPSNKEVRTYGQNLGDVLISFAGSAKAVSLISKFAPSLAKLLKGVKVKDVVKGTVKGGPGVNKPIDEFDDSYYYNSAANSRASKGTGDIKIAIRVNHSITVRNQ